MKPLAIPAYLLLLLCISCTPVTYLGSVEIHAPVGKVFSVIEDYENYPTFIPEFHNKTAIVSDIKKGSGVQFENESVWNGHKLKSTYEITAYEKDHKIEMCNLSQKGTTVMTLERISEDWTRYTLQVGISIPRGMKEALFAAFDREMNAVKDYCESHYDN